MPIVATVGFDLLDMAALHLIVALSKHHVLVGQEHGWTIPLAVLGNGSPPQREYQVANRAEAVVPARA